MILKNEITENKSKTKTTTTITTSTSTLTSTTNEVISSHHQVSNNSQNASFSQPQKNTKTTGQLIKSNGRPKVNTLPPWAKSHEDDDQLFQPVSIPSIPIFSPPRLSHSSSSENPTASKSQHLLEENELSNGSKKNQKPPSSPISTATIAPDSPPLEADWNQIRNKLKHHHFSTSQLATEYFSSHHDHNLLLPIVRGEHGNRRSSSSTCSSNRSHNHQSFPSTRRPLYRAMTSPPPVFQRLKPLITVNGHKKRTAEDPCDATDQQPPESSTSPSLPPPSGSSRHQPDDRWWQFTLPTKYRRKVEDYLSRGGQGIGGVHHFQTSEGSPGSTPPRMEMVEIDEDRRKIIALLKCHGSPFPVRRSSVDSNLPQLDLHHSYGSDPTITPSHRLSREDITRFNAFHSPTDFPLAAFSRKLSLTPSQQEQFLHPLSNHPTLGKNPFDESPRSLNMPTEESSSLSIHPHSSSRGGGRSKPNYYHETHNKTRAARIGFYFMHHPTAPLFCRLLNFILTVSSLAICATIRKIEFNYNLRGTLGSSTLFILVVAPLGLIHNLFAIYCEYFGAPIGIWSVSWKMFHTLSELVFVSLWSAGLALSMNDELRSPLQCAGKMNDNRTSRRRLMTNEVIPTDLHNKLNAIFGENIPQASVRELMNVFITDDYFQDRLLGFDILDQMTRSHIYRLCHLQASLVSIIFAGLALYSVVLIVSLFRIFLKVSRKR